MMTYDKVMEAIERGFIKGDKISIIRRNGKIHDYVLPGEKVEPGEIVTEEDVETVLEELREQDVREFLFEKQIDLSLVIILSLIVKSSATKMFL